MNARRERMRELQRMAERVYTLLLDCHCEVVSHYTLFATFDVPCGESFQ